MFIKECKRRSARKPGFEGLVATNGDGKGAEIMERGKRCRPIKIEPSRRFAPWRFVQRICENTIYGVYFLTCSAETLVRAGGIINRNLIASCLRYGFVKNYQHRLMDVRIIARQVSVVFFWDTVFLDGGGRRPAIWHCYIMQLKVSLLAG